jgi:hypothetical protein
MKSSGEEPLPKTAEGMMLTGDLQDTFKANAREVLVIDDYDTLEDLEYPTEVFLGGKLTQRRKGMSPVIGLLTWRLNNMDTTVIMLDEQKYEVDAKGIRFGTEPKDPLDDENI